jgi:hypothetical protein
MNEKLLATCNEHARKTQKEMQSDHSIPCALWPRKTVDTIDPIERQQRDSFALQARVQMFYTISFVLSLTDTTFAIGSFGNILVCSIVDGSVLDKFKVDSGYTTNIYSAAVLGTTLSSSRVPISTHFSF